MICIISNGKNTGIGEGVLYKGTTLSAIKLYKREIIPLFQKTEFKNPSEAKKMLSMKFSEKNSGLVCAIDMALWNLESNIKKVSLRELLKGKRTEVQITEELFMDQITSKNISDIVKNGTIKIKIKIGKNSIKDCENIKKTLQKFNLQIRADANQCFEPKDLKLIRNFCKELKIDEIEEPMPKKYHTQLNNRKNVILDESIISLSDLKKALSLGFGIYNVKLSRLGGLTRSLKFIKEIEKRGKKIIIGCSEELGIATHALLCLSSSVKNLHSTEGLGSERLKFDLIEPEFKIKSGMLTIPDHIHFSEKKLIAAAKKYKFKISKDGKISPEFFIYETKQDIIGKAKNLWLRLNLL